MGVIMDISDRICAIDFGVKLAEGPPPRSRPTRRSSAPTWAKPTSYSTSDMIAVTPELTLPKLLVEQADATATARWRCARRSSASGSPSPGRLPAARARVLLGLASLASAGRQGGDRRHNRRSGSSPSWPPSAPARCRSASTGFHGHRGRLRHRPLGTQCSSSRGPGAGGQDPGAQGEDPKVHHVIYTDPRGCRAYDDPMLLAFTEVERRGRGASTRSGRGSSTRTSRAAPRRHRADRLHSGTTGSPRARS